MGALEFIESSQDSDTKEPSDVVSPKKPRQPTNLPKHYWVAPIFRALDGGQLAHLESMKKVVLWYGNDATGANGVWFAAKGLMDFS